MEDGVKTYEVMMLQHQAQMNMMSGLCGGRDDIHGAGHEK
jgi:hypothetical protein